MLLFPAPFCPIIVTLAPETITKRYFKLKINMKTKKGNDNNNDDDNNNNNDNNSNNNNNNDSDENH